MGSTLDDTVATMEELDPPYRKVEWARGWGLDVVDLLLKSAEKSQGIYANPPGPKSEVAAARRLVEVYDVLQSLAILAERAKDGALLKERLETLASHFPSNGVPAPEPPREPWLPSRPKSVAEIPLFAQNLQQWHETVADYDHRGLGGDRPSRQPAKPTREPPQLVVMGRSKTPASSPLLLYFGNYGKLFTLVKTKEMTLKTEDGRIEVIAYILTIVADPSFPDNTGRFRDGFPNAKALAKALLNSDVIGEGGGVSRVFFMAEMSEINLIDHLKVGQSMKMVIDKHALNAIETLSRLRPEFKTPPEAAAPPKKGCAAIEWLEELMPEVPPEYKMLWVMRKIEDDRGVYAGNLTPGMTVPMDYFMPASGDSSNREVVFLGGAGNTAGDLLILTQEGRIFSINERMRDLQSFCTAVMSVAPFVAYFYMVAAIGGIVIAGELLPALLGEVLAGGSRVVTGTVGTGLRLTEVPRLVQWVDTLVAAKHWETVVHGGVAVAMISMDVHEAGGIQAYVKKLKDPWEAAFLLLNLLSVKGALNRAELSKMLQESRSLGESAQQLLRQEKTATQAVAAVADRDAAVTARATEAPAVTDVKGELAAARGTEPARPQIAGQQGGTAAEIKGETVAAQKTEAARPETPGKQGEAPTEVKGEAAPTQTTETTRPQTTDKDRGIENRLGQSETPQKKPETVFPEDEIAAKRRAKQAAAQAAEERKQAIEAVAQKPRQKAMGDREGPVMASDTPGGGAGQGPPTIGNVQTPAPSGAGGGANRVISLTTVRTQARAAAAAVRQRLASLVNSRGTRYVIQGNEAEFQATRRSHHVYEYYNEKGELLYVGVSGGGEGARALRNPELGFHNWVDRLQQSHLNTQWIGEARSVRVTHDITEQEMWALEEVLIPTAKYNKAPGNYSKIFKQGDAGANAASALKQPKATFSFEYVPVVEP